MTMLLVGLASYVALTIGQIVIAAQTKPSPARTALVLGAAAYGERPSPVFQGRLEHAAALFALGTVQRVVVTGGQGRAGAMAEGDVGARWLIDQGVPAAAILVERTSRTTRQNISEAAVLLPPAKAGRTVIISDPLHVARATAMARASGYDAIPGPTPTSRFRGIGVRAKFLVRELWLITVWRVAGI